jgi:hypothetical protein
MNRMTSKLLVEGGQMKEKGQKGAAQTGRVQLPHSPTRAEYEHVTLDACLHYLRS